MHITKTDHCRDYTYLGYYPDGIAQECQSTVTAGQQISLILDKTSTGSDSVVTKAWVTSISTAPSATVITGIPLNGWNFIPSTTTATSTNPPSSRRANRNRQQRTEYWHRCRSLSRHSGSPR